VARVAVLGGFTTAPMTDLLRHLLAVEGTACTLLSGQFDNYAAELLEGESAIHAFAPSALILLPSNRHLVCDAKLTDPPERHRAAATQVVRDLLALCHRANRNGATEVVLGNFLPPPYHDPGPYRARTLGSDWNFTRLVNMELGIAAPRFVQVCDVEFLAARRGLLGSRDERGWFESKQIGAPDLIADIAREAARIIVTGRRPPKKVLVMDLDQTLWGGVIGDEGLTGIELGDTSARGEAFKAFQRHLLSLGQRGVLLAVCSKNDEAIAKSVFERHPEMVLRLDHLAAFKANWNPKSDNIREIAAELGLGLDSLVFVDDNPAEIEIVRQFCPAVTGIALGPDPSTYVAQLKESRCFEPHQLTVEDEQRTSSYRAEIDRKELLAGATDMDSYLRSLAMVAQVRELEAIDVPRAAQLINKSNQFNLTTRRRTEGEVEALLGAPGFAAFTVRLADRFGDHGLISVVILASAGEALEVDTWVMSCRVLKRQVEDLVTNQIVRIARARRCRRVVGRYLPTDRNGLVRDLYPDMGFSLGAETPGERAYQLEVERFQERPTHITITRLAS
jgi:FkbH-like protein